MQDTPSVYSFSIRLAFWRVARSVAGARALGLSDGESWNDGGPWAALSLDSAKGIGYAARLAEETDNTC